MTELQLQAKCWQWYWNKYKDKRLRRIKNELDNHPRKTQKDFWAQIAENKASGIIAGTPDFMFLSSPMIWIEMKIDKGVLSDDQKEFRDFVMSIGHMFFVCWTMEEFQKLIYELHD